MKGSQEFLLDAQFFHTFPYPAIPTNSPKIINVISKLCDHQYVDDALFLPYLIGQVAKTLLFQKPPWQSSIDDKHWNYLNQVSLSSSLSPIHNYFAPITEYSSPPIIYSSWTHYALWSAAISDAPPHPPPAIHLNMFSEPRLFQRR